MSKIIGAQAQIILSINSRFSFISDIFRYFYM